MSGITMHTFREAWKNKIYRDGDGTLSKNHGICSKHFIETDFIPDYENDSSASLVSDVLEEQFVEESKLGMCRKVLESEARKEYPGDELLIAAIGALDKR